MCATQPKRLKQCNKRKYNWPIARPSAKLWKPSPTITIQATDATEPGTLWLWLCPPLRWPHVSAFILGSQFWWTSSWASSANLRTSAQRSKNQNIWGKSQSSLQYGMIISVLSTCWYSFLHRSATSVLLLLLFYTYSVESLLMFHVCFTVAVNSVQLQQPFLHIIRTQFSRDYFAKFGGPVCKVPRLTMAKMSKFCSLPRPSVCA